jgi:hypothetical protein
MSSLKFTWVRNYHTVQPIKTYTVWELDGGNNVKVHVKAAHMDQTWDLQPYKSDQEVVNIEGEVSPEMKAKILQHFEN